MTFYGPDEDSSTVLLERFFLAGDCVAGIGYGISVVLYLICANYLWRQSKHRRGARFLFAYITLLFCLSTIFTVVQAGTVQMMYIDNRKFPGGPWQYFLATQQLPINILFIACLFLLNLLADLLFVWRCWIIWAASGYPNIAYAVTSLPALMVLASLVMGVLWVLQSSQPGLSFYSSLPQAFGTSYLTISISLNVILTILIVIRLLVYRRRARSVSSVSNEGAQYVSLAAIFVESMTLYSMFAIAFLITYAMNHPSNQLFLGLAGFAQQIALYLIIYRLAQGRTWGRDTVSTRFSTHMNFHTPTAIELSQRSQMAISSEHSDEREKRSRMV